MFRYRRAYYRRPPENTILPRRYVSAHAFTWIYLGLGDKDRAFESMQHEYEDRSNCVAWHPVWHLLDGLRSDPRYLELMRRIGLLPPARALLP